MCTLFVGTNTLKICSSSFVWNTYVFKKSLIIECVGRLHHCDSLHLKFESVKVLGNGSKTSCAFSEHKGRFTSLTARSAQSASVEIYAAPLDDLSPDSDARPADAVEKKVVHVRVSGRVQGVSYRKWAMAAARRAGLDGWVRNRADGTVEAVFAGAPSAVDEMVNRCWIGSPWAVVSSVTVEPFAGEAPQGLTKLATL